MNNPLSSANINIFRQKLVIFVIFENIDKNCISIHNFYSFYFD